MTFYLKKSQNLLSYSSMASSLTNVDDRDKQVLRDAISEELRAVTLYEQMANSTLNEEMKKIFLDIAEEERVHIGEFECLLRKIDNKQTTSIIQGFQEVEEKTQK